LKEERFKALARAAAAALLAALVIFAVALQALGKTPMAVVTGSSMLPLLREGDLVFVLKKAPGEIKEGDVIVYRSLRGHLIVHRVVGVIVQDGRYEYVTKGDNNPYDDSFLGEFISGHGVPYERVVGVVASPFGAVLKIPYAGYITLLVRGK